jgi:hypothetical protein
MAFALVMPFSMIQVANHIITAGEVWAGESSRFQGLLIMSMVCSLGLVALLTVHLIKTQAFHATLIEA